MPFRFGRPLNFQRDLQGDLETAPDSSRPRKSRRAPADRPAQQQQPTCPPAAGLRLQQQQHTQRRRVGPSQQHADRAVPAAENVPLGFLAASLAHQGVPTAAAAEALAAVALAAAAFVQAAAQPAAQDTCSIAGPSADGQPGSCAQPAASAAAHGLRAAADTDSSNVRDAVAEVANRAAHAQVNLQKLQP